MEVPQEILTEEELASITGYQLAGYQIRWLEDNRWNYVLTGARRPVVGRLYARLKLAGVNPHARAALDDAWTLDLSKVS